MAVPCIPTNPDISGIGVRTATYAQNLLCFVPVFVYLWNGEVSREEISGIKDQSIGMLAIAFAILISTMIQATVKMPGQSITNFHAAIVLDLSWMNNTSTFIWFLLYAHHRSKNENKSILVHPTWSHWTKVLLMPLRRLGTSHSGASLERAEKGDDHEDGNQGRRQGSNSRNEGDQDIKQGVVPEKPSKRCISFIQRSWGPISQAPVLALGSVHLTLMSAVGIWLWSRPSKFGTPILCDPVLTVAGNAVRFSSPAMRRFWLLMYILFLIPGVNLLPAFFLLLSLHILYNKSRRRQPKFWARCRHILDAMRSIPRGLRNIWRLIADNALLGRGPAPLDEEDQVGDNYPLIPTGAQLADPPSGDSSSRNSINLTDSMLSQEQSVHPPPSGSSTSQSPSSDAHPAFLIVGLVCLALINIIFLVDIELTLSRNKKIQFHAPDEWGFGQVLALLLLVVPLRDVVTSINDIRRKSQRNVNRECEKHLRDAIRDGAFEGHDFWSLIEQGANPNAQVEGICFLRSCKDIH